MVTYGGAFVLLIGMLRISICDGVQWVRWSALALIGAAFMGFGIWSGQC
jgi:hypothetical protein